MSSGAVSKRQIEAREFGSLPPRNASYVKKAFRDRPSDESLLFKAARVIAANFEKEPQNMDSVRYFTMLSYFSSTMNALWLVTARDRKTAKSNAVSPSDVLASTSTSFVTNIFTTSRLHQLSAA
eukprot:g4911.t1